MYEFWNSLSAGLSGIIHCIFYSVSYFFHRNIVRLFIPCHISVMSFHLFVESLNINDKLRTMSSSSFKCVYMFYCFQRRAILMSINLIEKLFILFFWAVKKLKQKRSERKRKRSEKSRWFHLSGQKMLLTFFKLNASMNSKRTVIINFTFRSQSNNKPKIWISNHFLWPIFSEMKCFFRLLKTFFMSMLIFDESFVLSFGNSKSKGSKKLPRFNYLAKIFPIRIFVPHNAFVNWNSRCKNLEKTIKTFSFINKTPKFIAPTEILKFRKKRMRRYHSRIPGKRVKAFIISQTTIVKRYWKWIQKFLMMWYVTYANTIKNLFDKSMLMENVSFEKHKNLDSDKFEIVVVAPVLPFYRHVHDVIQKSNLKSRNSRFNWNASILWSNSSVHWP